MGYALPARVFSVDRGREHYSVTVADYRGIEQQGIARSKTCVPGAETCFGGQTRIVGSGYWKSDVHGAITYASFKLLQRDAKPTGMTWNWTEQVEGTLLQFTTTPISRARRHRFTCTTTGSTSSRGRCRRGLSSPSCSRCRSDSSARTERRRQHLLLRLQHLHGIGRVAASRSLRPAWLQRCRSGRCRRPPPRRQRSGPGARTFRPRQLLSHRWDRFQWQSVSVARPGDYGALETGVQVCHRCRRGI